jgi:tRNA(Glu) U13 pseudouridine synthase TruD
MNSSAKHKGWKASIGFDLPPGAYATVLVKRLFQ